MSSLLLDGFRGYFSARFELVICKAQHSDQARAASDGPGLRSEKIWAT